MNTYRQNGKNFIEVVFLYKEILLKVNLLLYEKKIITKQMFEEAEKQILSKEHYAR